MHIHTIMVLEPVVRVASYRGVLSAPIVLHSFQLPSARSIKVFLKSRLPPYAVPHVCILLDAIPINMASGKADKKKLPKSCNAEVVCVGRK